MLEIYATRTHLGKFLQPFFDEPLLPFGNLSREFEREAVIKKKRVFNCLLKGFALGNSDHFVQALVLLPNSQKFRWYERIESNYSDSSNLREDLLEMKGTKAEATKFIKSLPLERSGLLEFPSEDPITEYSYSYDKKLHQLIVRFPLGYYFIFVEKIALPIQSRFQPVSNFLD